MSRQTKQQIISKTSRPSDRPSHIAPKRSALVYHDGYAFEFAQDLRNQGFDVTDAPVLSASSSLRGGHLAVVAARPDSVRPQRLCTLLRELIGKGLPVLAIGAGLPAVVRLFGGKRVTASKGISRLADVSIEDHPVFAGLPPQVRLALPEGPALHSSAVSQELRVTARAKNGDVIGVSHVFRPVHAVHSVVLENEDLRAGVVTNLTRMLRERKIG